MSIIGLPNSIAGTISMCDTTHRGQVAPRSLLPRGGKQHWGKYFIAKNAMLAPRRIDDVHGNHWWPDPALNPARIGRLCPRLTAGVLTAALPTAGWVFIFAQRYESDIARISMALAASTAL